MVDIAYFRDEELLEKLRVSETRRGNDLRNIDIIISLDKEWKKHRYQAQQCQTDANSIQREISELKKLGRKDGYQVKNLIEQMKAVKKKITLFERHADDALEMRNNLMGTIGNIVHDSVFVSQSEGENPIVKEWKPATDENIEFFPKAHYSTLMDKLDMVAMKQGAKVAGHRGYFLKGYGVLLNQALIQFSLDFLMKREYELLQTPFMMNRDLMEKTAQLSDFAESLYSVDCGGGGDSKFLIATSEQPISAYHFDEWIDPKTLPIRYAGYSTCFRKEAGAHGKDVRGLFRVHQFEKVEQFVITTPEQSWNMHEKMLQISCEFMEALKLPYRVVNIVSGALNNAAAKKYDVEGWFPAHENCGEYRELVSCSNCTDYQSRNLLIRCGFKQKGEKAKFVHLLNSTLCATERTMCCILENYQRENGVEVPAVLRPYILGGLDFLPFKSFEKVDKKTDK